MKLEILLKKVPLPIYPERYPETGKSRIGSKGYAIHQGSEAVADGIQTPEVAEYLCHAANVLPELLAAAKNLRENWEHNLTEPMARLNEAIAMAENINPKTR